MKRFLFIFAIVCITFSALQLDAQAASDKVGSVVAIRGEATATDTENFTRSLELEKEIYREDIIRTGKRGRLQIMFLDNTIVSLGSDSELKVAEYEWNEENKQGKMKTEVKEGVFRIMGGAITKTSPENFITETPAATIGIRGSMFSFKVEEESLTVLFEGGVGIDITNSQGTISITQPGFGTQVMSLVEAPKPAVQFSEEEMTEIEKNLSGTPSDQGENQGEDQKDPDAREEKSEERKDKKRFNGENAPKDQKNMKPGDIKPPVVEVDHAPKVKPWDGFFISTSRQEAYNATGRWGISVDQTNGEILGGGIPIFGTASKEIGDEKPVLLRMENIRGNTNDSFRTDLSPDRGEAGGVMETAPIELQDVWNVRWGYVDAWYGENDIFYYWITGRRTPEERIRDMVARSIIGRYRAGAHGVLITASAETFLLHNGLTDLLFDFGKHSMTGQIKFDEVTLNISGSDVFPALPLTADASASIPKDTPGLFFANIIEEQSSDDADSVQTIGHINGMFYGENGNSLGGNFNALQNETQYLGIFGGNKEAITDFTQMNGKFMGGLFTANATTDTTNTENKFWYGDVSAKVYNNLIDGVMEGTTGESFSFKSYLPDSGEDSTTYTGSFSYPFEHELTLDESGQTVNLGMRIFTSNLKEFAIIESFNDALVLNKYKYGELAFFGVPSKTVPTDGISRYEGVVQAAVQDQTSYTDDDITLFANWNSGRVLGMVKASSQTSGGIEPGTGDVSTAETLPDINGTPQYPLIFMTGDVQGTQIANGQIFGFSGKDDQKRIDGSPTDDITDGSITPLSGENDHMSGPLSEWVDGKVESSQIYGSQNQGFGMTGSGTTISGDSLSSFKESTFRMIAAGFKDPVYTGKTGGTNTGTANWAGFAMGLAQHIEPAPYLPGENQLGLLDIQSHFLMNEDPESFRFTVDKDTGVLRDGFFTLTNMDGEDYNTYSFLFGDGKTDTAWIDNMTFVAELGSETPDQRGIIVTDTFRVIPDANKLPAVPEYLSWGYWGTTYTDIQTGETFTALVDKCFWVAGERTPEAKIQSLVAANITGTYVGGAYGSSVDPDGSISPLTNGQTKLDVNFGLKTITGDIKFDQVQFSLNNGSFSQQGGITANLSGTDVVYGQANGAFFGPDATVAAGTFKADMENEVKHMGVFLTAGSPK